MRVRRRRRATADGGERRRTPANSPVCLDFELGNPISSALCTVRWRARRQSHPGWCDCLRWGGDGARCGEAERRDGEAPASERGRLRAQARKQMAPTASSPPSAASGQLLDGEAAAATKINSGGVD
jgi:hypothetical protein